MLAFLTIALILVVIGKIGFMNGVKSVTGFDTSELNRRLGNIGDQLERISIALKADEAIEKKKKSDKKKLIERLVKQLIRDGKSINEAQHDAEEATIKEEYLLSVERWVQSKEEDELHEKEYGYLLSKAEKYIVDLKSRWKKGESIDLKVFDEKIGVNWEGREWLMKKLSQMKLVTERTKWDAELNFGIHDSWNLG